MEFYLTIDPDMDLYLTGHKGDVEQLWANDKPIPKHQEVDVARLIRTGNTNNYGWAYLGTAPGRLDYQLYLEIYDFQKDYASFCWYDPNSTEKNSCPSPFPPGVATAAVVDYKGHYRLLRVPPK